MRVSRPGSPASQCAVDRSEVAVGIGTRWFRSLASCGGVFARRPLGNLDNDSQAHRNALYKAELQQWEGEGGKLARSPGAGASRSRVALA